jgi:cytidyltransferase-like protein
VFDLFHVSHLVYLQRCKAYCDELYVGVDSDEMVRKAKGDQRPIIPQTERLQLIENLGLVDHAFILYRVEDLEVVAAHHKIDKVFKHETFRDMKNVFGVQNSGAKLVILPDIPNMVSTTAIIDRIVSRYGS